MGKWYFVLQFFLNEVRTFLKIFPEVSCLMCSACVLIREWSMKSTVLHLSVVFSLFGDMDSSHKYCAFWAASMPEIFTYFGFHAVSP